MVLELMIKNEFRLLRTELLLCFLLQLLLFSDEIFVKLLDLLLLLLIIFLSELFLLLNQFLAQLVLLLTLFFSSPVLEDVSALLIGKGLSGLQESALRLLGNRLLGVRVCLRLMENRSGREVQCLWLIELVWLEILLRCKLALWCWEMDLPVGQEVLRCSDGRLLLLNEWRGDWSVEVIEWLVDGKRIVNCLWLELIELWWLIK